MASLCELALPQRSTMAFAFTGGCPCCAVLPNIESTGPEPPLLLGLPLVDSHCHVHKAARPKSGDGPPSYNAVLAIEEACWDTVLARCATNPYAAPGLGVHPWFVHALAPGWADRLRAKLEAHPGALVGEIGLCKCARNLRGPGAKARVWPLQVDAFETQLHIGGALRRPASVHCVKAHTKLIEILEGKADAEHLPAAIALHSFSGTAEQVRRLLALRPAGELLYFGFSHTVNVAMGGEPGSPAHEALLQAIRAVPEERLLVESDCDNELAASQALRRAVQLVADARDWTVERAAELTTSNGMNFLQSGACGKASREARSLLAAACASEDPSSAVHATARTLRDAGIPQGELHAMLEGLRAAHTNDEGETTHNALRDTIRSVVGWHSRGSGLRPGTTPVTHVPHVPHPTWPSAHDGVKDAFAAHLQAQWQYQCAMTAMLHVPSPPPSVRH